METILVLLTLEQELQSRISQHCIWLEVCDEKTLDDIKLRAETLGRIQGLRLAIKAIQRKSEHLVEELPQDLPANSDESH